MRKMKSTLKNILYPFLHFNKLSPQHQQLHSCSALSSLGSNQSNAFDLNIRSSNTIVQIFARNIVDAVDTEIVYNSVTQTIMHNFTVISFHFVSYLTLNLANKGFHDFSYVLIVKRCAKVSKTLVPQDQPISKTETI